ncbi:ABC transporter permease [Streptococcus pneumoniae]|nr:ABC transporter permease [Streptococcus pneumoniae]CAG5230472.1 ABC transporter permease [Streptococcus pneumoniae]CAG5252824.1 ABC transporter permease [Streptococcus pneumoniae]CAG5319754.1 ABC transporter permease [Streptococcus pneumoniae]
MKKYQRMHLIFIRQYLKQIMEYKADFLVGVVGVFLTQGLNMLFLNILFQHIPLLDGWSFLFIRLLLFMVFLSFLRELTISFLIICEL